ncbi:MAG: ABC transporter substrate-binding protein [Thalassospira sp.]|uniref:ABC transporter substrate-binding protein n=1 Tax=unclassified Thalassospira TaxID=2648997 RepID=UPI000C64A9BE|nr:MULTISPECIES: ABC transporter substrate-binding protein [unclassified Thalassospira]MBE72751.1 ABC transporter substrate-binding protein [Thalassospira sp.]QPO12982.1 ABC transporter substrate-binding protein [Thalassospira sp. A40-3]
MRSIRFLCSVFVGCFLLVACDQSGPIKIGFIAGLSGPGSDAGTDALDALKLAAQQVNTDGGINGRMVEIIPRDDLKTPEVAQNHVRELKRLGVDAIVGPIISSIGMAMLPVINELGVVTISPTVSAADFAGFRDNLFRMNTTTRENARAYARRYIDQGYERVALALDGQNQAFTDSWYREFLLELDALDGRVISKIWINTDNITHAEAASQLLADDPDAIVLITNSTDSAQMAQEIRKLSSSIPLAVSEWAGSQALIEVGGEAVEGVELAQAYDRYDTNPRFQKFVAAFNEMFGRQPGYTAVLGYDAATVLFAALRTKHPDQSLADALTNLPPQQGLHQELVFDAFGDGNRNIYFVAIQDGKFIRVD